VNDAAGSSQGMAAAAADATAPVHRGVDYRRDIDGLRAVAVGLVLLYHSGLGLVRGGFIGVDVFFVISGYLITRVIATDIAHHRFSLFEFYRRRIKRLMPAYALIAAATLALGWFISLPAHYRDTAQGVFSSAGYFSNIWLWHEAGSYFAGQAEIKPMLHTWSLSVEEQFYIVFPLIMLGLVRLGAAARTLRTVFVVLFLASLAWAQWLLTRDASASFYLLPSRAWELMAGAALALGGMAAPARVTAAALQVGIGLLLILASALLLRAGPHFPGIAALPACLGSMLVLQGGRVANGVSRVFLENGPMVFIGKISYSLYLWHWPLFAFYRYYFMAEPTVPVSLSLLALSILCATASWAWIERPFRRRAALPGIRVLLFAMATSGSLMAASALIQLGGGLPKRFSAEIQAIYNLERQFDSGGCLNETAAQRPPGQACVLGATGVTPQVALWGDSHAYVFARPLEEVFRERNLSFRLYGFARCPPVLGVEPDVRGEATGCAGYNAETLARLLRDRSIGTVIMAGRHSLPMIGFYGMMEPDEPAPVAFTPMAGLPDAPRDAAYLARMAATVRALVAGGKHVVLVMPTPEIGFDVPQAVGLAMMRHSDPNLLRIPRDAYLRRQWQIRAMLSRLAHLPGVSLVDPGPLVCPDDSCHPVQNGVVMYADDDHLSHDAVRRLMPQLLAAIGGAAATPPGRPPGRD
jgi:peptidoglycan/LPS O-acetylase OafA/YrhL